MGVGPGQRMDTHPRRPIPLRSATLTSTTLLGLDIPPQDPSTEPISRVQPNLRHNKPYSIRIIPLEIAELCVALVTSLEAFLKAAYKVASFT